MTDSLCQPNNTGLMVENLVVIDKVKDINSKEEIGNTFFKILDYFKPIIKIPRNATIVIKVNLCLLIGPETGGTVDPVIAKLLCRWFLEHYDIKKIYLAEADATHLDANMAFKVLGWKNLTDEMEKVSFLNLTEDAQVNVQPEGATYLKRLNMSKSLMNADLLVSLAKLKTHTKQKITCIMKNQFGSISHKYKITYHPRLAEAICDATAARIPDLCIVDGLIAMEGNGPTNGFPKRTKLLLASNNPVAMDHFCARLMGFRPMSIPHLRLGVRRELGSTDYKVLGDPPNPLNLRFKFVPKWKTAVKKCIGLIQNGAVNEET